MQDLGNAGQSVIGNKVPNSFTTDRIAISWVAWHAQSGNSAGLLCWVVRFTPNQRRGYWLARLNRPDFAPALAQGIRRAPRCPGCRWCHLRMASLAQTVIR